MNKEELIKKDRFALKVGVAIFILILIIANIIQMIEGDVTTGIIVYIIGFMGFIFGVLVTLTIITYNHMHKEKEKGFKIGLMILFLFLLSSTILFFTLFIGML